MAGSVRRISDGNRIYNARRTEFVPGTDRSARTEFVPGTDRSPLYDGHLVRRRWGRPASSRNVRGVSLAGGGGFESSPTSSRRTRCPSYKRLIDVRTGGWLSIGRIGIAPFFSLYDGHRVRRRWGRLASSRNVRWVLLAGGGGIESSSTSSRRTRCPSYRRLIDMRTGDSL